MEDVRKHNLKSVLPWNFQNFDGFSTNCCFIFQLSSTKMAPYIYIYIYIYIWVGVDGWVY